MTLKLGAIADWTRVDKGNSIVLPGSKYRKVRLEVMSIIQTSLLLVVGEKREIFPLGSVNGHQTIEFYVDGDVVVDADANVFYKSSDGQPTHVERPDAVTFTRIAQRRARNYQQELLEYRMWQNSNKRIERLEKEFRQKMQRMGVDPDTGEVIDDKKSAASPKGADTKQAKPSAGSGSDKSSADKAAGDESSDRSKGDGEPPASAGG